MHTRSICVLVVDDSPLELELTVHFLKEHLQVISATNGVDALELVTKHKPMVVLLDVNMPGMNGYEVCQHIRELITSLRLFLCPPITLLKRY